MKSSTFKQQLESLVAQIPVSRVATYGQLAALLDQPQAARAVGGLAHFGPVNLPWHRVVNAQGGLANGYPGGRRRQYQQLRAEGVIFSDNRRGYYRLQLAIYQWQPDLH